MRTLAIVLFLSTQLLAQGDLPTSVGTGEFPPRVDVSTDIRELRELEIEAFTLAYETLKKRSESGQMQVGFLLDTLSRLTDARLKTATSKRERLDVIQDSFVAALAIWQRVFELRKVGQRGGESDTEAITRSATFRYRFMWLQEFMEGAGQGTPALNVDSLRLPENFLKGELPFGLDSTDLGIVSDLQVKALEACLQIVKDRYERGLFPVAEYCNTIEALNDARLIIATTKQARLDVLEGSLVNALLLWQRIHELQKVGQRGGEADAEAKARAVLLGYRARWLEEKLDPTNEKDITIQLPADSDGIPDQIGTGQFPPGLETAKDLESVRKLQIEALERLQEVVRKRMESGVTNLTIVLNAQKDLALARLAFTQDAKKRLEYIEEAFVGALKIWQYIVRLGKAQGTSGDAEFIPRAIVYHYRVMWLMEKEKQK